LRRVDYSSRSLDPETLRVYLHVLRQALDDLEVNRGARAAAFREALGWFERGGEEGLAEVAIVSEICGIPPAMLYERVARKLREFGHEPSERVEQIRLRLAAGERLEEIGE
jgi:hypothetical protein